MVVDLTAAGLVQGFSWAGARPLGRVGDRLDAVLVGAQRSPACSSSSAQGFFFYALWVDGAAARRAQPCRRAAAGGGGLMERFGASFLVAGVVTFLLGFFLQGVMPIITLRRVPVRSVEEIAARRPAGVRPARRGLPGGVRAQLRQARPAELRARPRTGPRHLHRRGVLALPLAVRAAGLERGPALRPGVAGERVPERDEPAAPLRHAAGRSRSDPRSRARHSNDWQMAHLYDPRSVAPYSVMPAYPWFFDERPAPDGARARRRRLPAVARQLGSSTAPIRRAAGHRGRQEGMRMRTANRLAARAWSCSS